nr:reverse transcriptase domain-containing protein [Tanacetum cinerariifolium]
MSYKEPPIPPTGVNQQEPIEVTKDTEPQNSEDIHPPTVQVEVHVDKPADEPVVTVGDHRKVQINKLNELHDQAYENYLIYKEKTKMLHDLKIKNRVFNIGDRVLLFNSHPNIFSGKLKSCWSGPFTISQFYPYGTVELS